MKRHRLLPLCALLGVLLAGLLPNLEAQEAQDSADLVLLIDGSENVGAANFPFVRDLVLRIIEPLDVGRDAVRVALALYNGNPQIKFYLNSYDSKSSVLEAVKGLSYSGGDESNLGFALEEVARSLLSQTAGGRASEGVPQMLVVISAGPSTDDTGAGDRAIKRANVITFGVAIGDTASADLEAVATDKSFVLSAPDFRTVASMGDQLLPFINGVVQRTIIVQNKFTEVLAVGPRDIIFLIDSTMGATLINSLREFIKRFVNIIPIGPDGVQVGVAQFSNIPRLKMDLNSYGSREELTAALGSIKPRPGQTVNIGAALDFVRTNMLRPEKGSRIQQGVPQVLLLMTSKKSSDSVEAPAIALQRLGVLTLAAGSKTATENELRQIAFADTVAFYLKDFRSLIRNPKAIVDALSTLAGVVVTEGPTEPVLAVGPRDIIFLIDSTMGATLINSLREFIKRFVNIIPIGPDGVQVGVAQFSNIPRLEMDLNSYGSREELTAALGSIKPRPGQTVNIGAALDFVRTNMLRPEKGSRIQQGVPQVLLLMTSKKSSDSVEAPAIALQRLGVLTLAAGSKTATENELRQIAFADTVAFYLKDFRSLIRNPKAIVDALSTLAGVVVTDGPTEPVLAVGPRDIIFLIDSTMGATLINSLREFIKRFVNIIPIGPDGVQVGVAQFSNIPRLKMDLNSYGSREELTAALGSIKPRPGQTVNIGAALDFVRTNMLRPEKGSRIQQGVPQVLLLMTSKKSSDSVEAPAIALQRLGVLTLAAGSKTATENELRQIAFADTVAFYLKDFRSLIRNPKAIVDALSTLAGVVVTEGPTEPAQDSADLVLLIDGSENVGAANFPFVRNLVLRIIEPLDVGRDAVRVALALYNGNPQIKFYLNSYDSKSSVLEAVKGLSYSGGDESNLGFALEKVARSLLSQTAGGRADEGVPQMLVVISAGPSTDDTGAGNRAIKRANVITFGVAIGDTASADLEAVATDKSFVLSAPDFRTVASMGDQLLPFINGVVQRTIIVQNKFTEVLAVGPRDIIFLIDSTMGATLINSLREFIKRFVNIMPIGPDGVQVGVAQFSNIPRLKMDLNSYGSREELTAALGSIKPRPGQTVNIGAALDFVRTNMLRPEKGSRIQQGVPQVLLLMTSKKSSDSVEASAIALQRLGVLTLAAGSKTATENELRQIAFADTVAFYLKDFRSLIRNPKAIVDALSTLAGVVVTEGPTEPVVEITTVQTQKVVRDIVFLVDGSNYVGSRNFPYVRDFIINVVNQLDVRPDRVRIGLLQFAESQNIEFHLNSYSSRQDVVNKISQLRLTGGSVLNTGAAMNYALINMFQPSTGSRRKQGVQQVLVLITGGPVQDQAKNAADKLALAGVLTFTVSSGQADEALMKTVAFVEDLAYHETSFSNLPGLAELITPKLITVVGDTDVTETTLPEETGVVAGAERDVAFLIDGTENV